MKSVLTLTLLCLIFIDYGQTNHAKKKRVTNSNIIIDSLGDVHDKFSFHPDTIIKLSIQNPREASPDSFRTSGQFSIQGHGSNQIVVDGILLQIPPTYIKPKKKRKFLFW